MARKRRKMEIEVKQFIHAFEMSTGIEKEVSKFKFHALHCISSNPIGIATKFGLVLGAKAQKFEAGKNYKIQNTETNL